MKSSVKTTHSQTRLTKRQAEQYRRQHWTNVDWSKPQVFPPFRLKEGYPTNHSCNMCGTAGRKFEILDTYGIVGIVCSQECYALWILKHI